MRGKEGREGGREREGREGGRGREGAEGGREGKWTVEHRIPASVHGYLVSSFSVCRW